MVQALLENALNLLKTNPNILNNPDEPKPSRPIRKLYKVRSGRRPMSPEAMRAKQLAINAATIINVQPSNRPVKPEPLPSRKLSCVRKRQVKNPQSAAPTKAEIKAYSAASQRFKLYWDLRNLAESLERLAR